MSENTTNKNVRDDEIDLLDLFRRMGRTINHWVKSVGIAFLIITVFLIKRWLPLGLSIVLGVGASYLIKVTVPSSYTSDLVLRNNTMSNADMISHLNRLHTYCKEKNAQALAAAISSTLKQVNNINDISAYWIIDKSRYGSPDFVDYKNNHNIYDTTNIRMQDRLDVRVRVKSPEEFPNISRGILSFISSDSLFQQRNRIRINHINELIFRLNYDILQLDSLQKVKYFEETRNRQPQNGGQMIFLQEQKTQLVYSDIYSLYTRKQTLETERELYKDIVTVLSEFPLPSKQENDLLFYCKYVVPIFFGITIILLILFANRKKLTEVYNKY
jgi:hypothetical protein